MCLVRSGLKGRTSTWATMVALCFVQQRYRITKEKTLGGTNPLQKCNASSVYCKGLLGSNCHNEGDCRQFIQDSNPQMLLIIESVCHNILKTHIRLVKRNSSSWTEGIKLQRTLPRRFVSIMCQSQTMMSHDSSHCYVFIHDKVPSDLTIVQWRGWLHKWLQDTENDWLSTCPNEWILNARPRKYLVRIMTLKLCLTSLLPSFFCSSDQIFPVKLHFCRKSPQAVIVSSICNERLNFRFFLLWLPYCI